MTCRVVMCSDCTTRLDGVNTCRACVAASADPHPPVNRARLVQRAPLAAALFVFVALEVYVTLYTLLLW